MATPAHRDVCYTRAEYISLERMSNGKHEYLDGQIYAMAGGTPDHSSLAAAVIARLSVQLGSGRCRVHTSDLRIRVLATGLSTYPDVSVVCGPWERAPDDSDEVTNPTVLVEVLSKNTEKYDRGDRFEHYKRIPTLRQYVLVGCRERRVEVLARGEGEEWTRALALEGEVAVIDAIGARLDVRELYEAAGEPRA